MIARIVVFVGVALLGYVGTVVAALVFWHYAGASGPDADPLLFVLFVLAPAVALVLPILVLRRLRKPPPKAAPESGREAWRSAPAPRRNRPVQIGIAIVVMVLLGAFMAWLGPSSSTFTYIPRVP